MDLQQKLMKHIKKDKKENVAMMKEITAGINFSRLNHQYHEEEMRRSWAALLKFYKPKELAQLGIHEKFPWQDGALTHFFQRCTPSLPQTSSPDGIEVEEGDIIDTVSSLATPSTLRQDSLAGPVDPSIAPEATPSATTSSTSLSTSDE